MSEVTAAAKSRAARAFCNIKRLEQEKQYRTQRTGARPKTRSGANTRLPQAVPNGLPHNALGVKYARYMCRTLAFFDFNRRARALARPLCAVVGREDPLPHP